MPKTVFYIKLTHSLFFLLIVICTIYIFLTALWDQINQLTWWAFSIVTMELVVLIVNDWRCPLTDLAERKGADVGSVAGLFLPKSLSRHLFTVFTVVFVLICLLLTWRTLW